MVINYTVVELQKFINKEGASSGQGKTKSLLFIKSKRPSLKRFIITGYLDRRNHVYFVKKHYGVFYSVLYIALYTPRLLRRIVGILLFDDFKLIRIYLLLKGLWDGLISKMGKPKYIGND